MQLHFPFPAQCQQSLAFFSSELFRRVQLAGIFDDSKTFADAIPKSSYDDVLLHYQHEQESNIHFDLANFVAQHFILPDTQELTSRTQESSVTEHIKQLWQVLKKPADPEGLGSLLPLKHPYLVPGGRFREIYYWDSYFSALGLLESGEQALVEDMLNNFVELQRQYGVIPNGNRSYYLTRSQPPVLAMLVELLLPYQDNQLAFIRQYIDAITTEYDFWMQGREEVSTLNCHIKRLVRMPDGSLLNRYWDDSTSARPESFREDIELAKDLPAERQSAFFRNVRAACESGWDFSSRWLEEPKSLTSIRTTSIVPIDLNCLLFGVESLLSKYHARLKNSPQSALYAQLAQQRKAAINRYLWSPEQGFFFDYDIEYQRQSQVKSLAGIVPLFVQLADEKQAQQLALAIEQDFLQAGGVVTTLNETDQQWDSPNGWAPLQWFCVQGLINYHQTRLATDIMRAWIDSVECYFAQTGKLMEKYDVCQQENTASGGEYDVQEGFGWTNGVSQVFYRLLSDK